MGVFPTNILLATDGSAEAELAAQTATILAQSTGSELHVLTVGGGYHPRYAARGRSELPEETLQKLEREARETLDEQVRKIEEAGCSVTQHHLGVGNPAEEIVAQAEEMGAGLIAMGSRGLGGIRRALMGSVSDSVVRYAPCPVVVVRGGKREDDVEPGFSSGKILWATDGSEEAELAGRTAVEMADETGSELHVVHVGPLARYAGAATLGGRAPLPSAQDALDKEARRLLHAQAKKVEAAGGVVARAHLRSSERPDAEIVSLAEEIGAGLIAMGSRGLGGIRRLLLGSVSDAVVRHAYGSVLVVRKGSKQGGNAVARSESETPRKLLGP